MSDKNTFKPVSKDEVKVAFAGQAIYSNKIYVSKVPLGLRIAFCEQRDDAGVLEFRSAVFLPVIDAMSLRDLLNKQLEGVKIELEEAASDEASD